MAGMEVGAAALHPQALHAALLQLRWLGCGNCSTKPNWRLS